MARLTTTARTVLVLGSLATAATAQDCNFNGIPDATETFRLFEISQWANRVIDRSSELNPVGPGAALQVLGAPDTVTYGDNSTAWQPLSENGTLEHITVDYATPVYATGLHVWESSGNGFVYRVDLIDVNDQTHTIWTGPDGTPPGGVIPFNLGFVTTSYLVKGVTVFVDTDLNQAESEQIDAIQLVGFTEEYRQWGSYVIDKSSQYTDTDWSAEQALGEPDTLVYGDHETAWAAALENGGPEFLSIGYVTPVYASGVMVRETNGNGFVRQIDVIDEDGESHVVWSGFDPSEPGTPANFQVDFPLTGYLVTGVTVHIDGLHDLGVWEEIDAVQLIGRVDNDCNGNGTPDDCEIRDGLEMDLNGNLRADVCDPDCNDNDVPDDIDIANGDEADVNSNRIPDACDPDCNGNGIPDDVDIDIFVEGRFEPVAFSFESPTLDWSMSCDECNTGVVPLPFPMTMGGHTYTGFEMDSNGHVELLRDGDTPNAPVYGYVGELVNVPDGNGETHTYLLAGYDDLDSEHNGFFGYQILTDRVIFYWNTETYQDEETGLLNEYQIVLRADSVDWNFNSATFVDYDYDLFSGIHLGYGEDLLIEAFSRTIPSQTSVTLILDELGGGSLDENGDGVPDECCPVDWDGNGIINSDDFFGFANAFLAGDADYDGDGVTNSADFFGFLSDFLNGC